MPTAFIRRPKRGERRGVWLIGATMAWFCFVSLVFTRPEVRQRFFRHGHWIDRVLEIALERTPSPIGLEAIAAVAAPVVPAPVVEPVASERPARKPAKAPRVKKA